MKDKIQEIAKKYLRISTLETRNSDRLDFYEVSVGSIKDALEAAYQAGENAGWVEATASEFPNFDIYDIEEEIKKAYADCWMDSFQEASKIRNLNFRASLSYPKEYCKELLNKYVKSYNAFTPDLLDHLPKDSCITIAREGSVCIYVNSETINKFSEKELKELIENLSADEFEYIKDLEEYRIWWD